jgi:hypothetical protein
LTLPPAEEDVRLPRKTIEERVDDLETDLAIIVATKGTLRLCTAHVALIWAILIAMCGVFIFVLQSGWETKQNTEAIIAIASKVDTHISTPGHAVSLDRVAGLQRSVDEVKELLKDLTVTLNRR